MPLRLFTLFLADCYSLRFALFIFTCILIGELRYPIISFAFLWEEVGLSERHICSVFVPFSLTSFCGHLAYPGSVGYDVYDLTT